MGLFDLFRSKKSNDEGLDRDLARLKKLSESKLSQDLDRPDAIAQLARLGTADAARILLARFNWTLDPSIRDQEEKEVALQGVIAAGRDAIEPIRAFVKRADGATWPIKALREILPEAELGAEVALLLKSFDADYSRNPEPKIQLLQALEETRDSAQASAVETFLDDVTEAVRFAAVNAHFSLANGTFSDRWVHLLANDESLRIRNRIAELLVERAESVPAEHLDAVSRGLPRGFRVSDGLVTGAKAG